MPIYEYQCTSCAAKFELLIFASSKDKPACPECGAAEPQKLMSTFSRVSITSSGLDTAPCGATSDCGIGGDMAASESCAGCCGHKHG